MKSAPKAVIIGPTASGKTEAAEVLAARWQAGILSADSRQIYRGLNRLANKQGEKSAWTLTGGEQRTIYCLDGVPQFGLDLVDIGTRYTIMDFQREAERLFEEPLPLIIAGGSTLYVDAVMFAMQPGPTDLALRRELEQVSRADLESEYAKATGTTPPSGQPLRRLIRQVEQLRLSGSLPAPPKRQFPDVPWYGIAPSREELYERIAARQTPELEQALLAEAQALSAIHGPEPLETLGLWPALSVKRLHGELTAEEFHNQLLADTKAYARRQLTWWRRYPWITWFSSAEALTSAVA